jgi:hypothetical protein
VQLGQIRQAVYRELLGISLASRRKSFNKMFERAAPLYLPRQLTFVVQLNR